MSRTKRLLAAVLIAPAVLAAPAAMPVLAPAANADPCAVSHRGDLQNHRGTFTAHITANPCGLRVRAYVDCTTTFGRAQTAYGPYITGTGASVADCGRFIQFNPRRGVTT